MPERRSICICTRLHTSDPHAHDCPAGPYRRRRQLVERALRRAIRGEGSTLVIATDLLEELSEARLDERRKVIAELTDEGIIDMAAQAAFRDRNPKHVWLTESEHAKATWQGNIEAALERAASFLAPEGEDTVSSAAEDLTPEPSGSTALDAQEDTGVRARDLLGRLVEAQDRLIRLLTMNDAEGRQIELADRDIAELRQALVEQKREPTRAVVCAECGARVKYRLGAWICPTHHDRATVRFVPIAAAPSGESELSLSPNEAFLLAACLAGVPTRDDNRDAVEAVKAKVGKHAHRAVVCDFAEPAPSGETGGGARCSMCGDLGWILDCNDLGKPGPRMVELLPCLIPDCKASGQPLQSITFGHGPARFTTAAMHPSAGWIMAVRNPKETP